METYKINRSLLITMLMIIMTVVLCFYVDVAGKLTGIDKKLGNKDLADFNWTYAR